MIQFEGEKVIAEEKVDSGRGISMNIILIIISANKKLFNTKLFVFCYSYVGETERRIEELFIKARREAPSLILIDDVDSLCPRKNNMQNDIERRVTAALCSQIDSLVIISSVL